MNAARASRSASPLPRARFHAARGLAAALLVLPASTWAQAPEAPVREPDPAAPGQAAEAPPPSPEPLEAAIANGYRPRPQDEPAGSLLGGMLALVPGFFVHGLGHYYVGEEGTALKLLLTEVVAVALIAAAVALDAASEDSGQVGPVRRALLHGGTVLFLGSWAADILGAFKGGDAFEADTTRTEATMLGLAYRYTNDPRTDFRHHLVARLNLDGGRLYVRPLVDLEPSLDQRQYELDLGYRVLRGEDPHNHLALGTRLRREEVPVHGFAVRRAEVYLKWRADLGLQIRSLRNFYVQSRIGVGRESYTFSRAGGLAALLAPGDYSDDYLVLETGAGFNVGRRTHLAALLIQDPTRDVAASSPETGLMEVQLVHRYRDDLDIELSLTAGDGWGLWLGLGYGL